MGSHETGPATGERPFAGRSCPLPGVAARPLSWELGERLVGDETTRRRATLSAPDRRTAVSVFDAADHTAVVAVRTPVGRRKFYEAPADAVDRALDGLADDGRWQVTART